MRLLKMFPLAIAAAALAAVAGLSGPAAAAEAYPSRNVEVVVPFGPGGGADVMGRQFARLAEPRLGTAMPVLNVAGASGDLGLGQVAANPADGHTVGQVIALTVNAWAAGVGTPRLDQFEYLALMQNSPSMLFVGKDGPFKDAKALFDHARANPGTLDVATSGVGTPDDITVRYLGSVGAGMVAVAFAKPGERYASVVGGHVDVLYEEPGDVVGFLQSGDLKPVVVFDAKRHAAFPDVPASAELGFEIGDLPNFRALAVRKGTPPERVERLRAVAREIAGTEEWQAFCANTYSCTDFLPPAEVKALVDATYAKAKGYLERLPAQK